MVYNLNDLPLTLRVEEVAEILRIGRGSAYELIRCGRLHAIRMGRRNSCSALFSGIFFDERRISDSSRRHCLRE